jgi:preprotein translocase SecE subunit
MASSVKDEQAKSQEDERDHADEREEKEERRPAPESPRVVKEGFFHIYKSGQGYWTRMGTAAGAGLIAALFANFLYHQLPVWFGSAGMPARSAKMATIYVIAGVMAIFALLVFWLTNKPANVDFLIATDSEMKKVNWTSRKELWGSTKVVIVFMFLIAAMLFAFDILFGYLFYFIGVLQSKPF